MVNAWISHVQNFAKSHGIKYGAALADKRCSGSYKKSGPSVVSSNKKRKSRVNKSSKNKKSRTKSRSRSRSKSANRS